MSQSSRSETNDFHNKSIDWFLYESSIDLTGFNLLIYCIPNHLNEVFEFLLEDSVHFRNNFWNFKNPSRKSKTGIRALSFVVPR